MMQQQILKLLFGSCCLVAARRRYTGECDSETPEFSHLTGEPLISPVVRPHGHQISGVWISWTVDQVLFSPDCADAWEVEHQQVGGGRLSWSPWSAMVSCAPYRTSQSLKEFSCSRRIDKEMCGRRVRYRVVAHNSRRLDGVKVLPSPFQETLVRCSVLGEVTSVQTGVISSGRDNKALSDIERRHKDMVARSRDRVLRDRNNKRARQVEFRRTSSTTTTTTTITTTTTTTTTRPTTVTTTVNSPVFGDFDPTLYDDQYYGDYYDYYSEATKKKSDKEAETAAADVPISCSYSSWTPWTPCSIECGSGVTRRGREVTHGSVYFCLNTNQTKSCFGTRCPNKVFRGDKVSRYIFKINGVFNLTSI